MNFGKLYDIGSYFNRERKRKEEGEIVKLFDVSESNEPKNILEVGAGTCRFSVKIKEKYPYANVYATDINENYLMVGKEKNKKIKTLCCQTEQINEKFKDNFFDFILAVDTIHHHRDRIKTLQNLFLCLKPNGFLVIREIDRDNKNFFKYKCIDKTDFILTKLQGKSYISPQYFSKDELWEILNLVGFRIFGVLEQNNMMIFLVKK